MFEFLMCAVAAVVLLGMIWAYAGSRDVFHPLMFVGPMMLFMYVWMPMKLAAHGGLDGFFQTDQLVFVQAINLAAIACFVHGCLSVGSRVPAACEPEHVSEKGSHVLVASGIVLGFIGLAAWAYAIREVGGLYAAFSEAYSGGWDDNGYIRDASLLMFPAFLMILTAALRTGRFRFGYLPLLALFIAPWMIQAVFTARRGPTFMISTLMAMGWYMIRGKRPALLLVLGAGSLLGFLMLFLVTNRGNIHFGADQDLTTDVTSMVEKPDTGNEYIYGTGAILSAEALQKFYWGRRYLAQVFVRPIPRAVWPNKYEDFGVGELEHNAGTGEGFVETLGWEGAAGSAPGVVADLWLEFRWLNIPILWMLGRLFGVVWKKTHLVGGPWVTQYVICSALSIYFVMQTMEAVIFRLLILSIPTWLVWTFARSRKTEIAAGEFSISEDGSLAPL